MQSSGTVNVEPVARTREPATVAEPARRAPRSFPIERYGVLAFFLTFFVVVGVMKGSAYISSENILLVLGQNSHLAFAAAAVTITLIAGQFDLSVGSMVGLAAILMAGLPSREEIPVVPAILLVVAAGGLAGLFNGVLVTCAKVNAFIATLGTGGAMGGIALLYSKSQTLFEGIPAGLVDAGSAEVAGVPLALLLAIALMGIAWALTRQTVTGRYWYAIGSRPEAARLAGVRVRKLTILAFVATGVIAAIGGIILTARFGSADPRVGPDLLLPAFAGAFLGSSILSDGRFMVVGSILATFLIAFATNGLEVLGLSAGVKPIFNGLVLVGAVAVTEELRRRRGTRSVLG